MLNGQILWGGDKCKISSLNFAKRKMSISILETIKIMMKVIYFNNLKK